MTDIERMYDLKLSQRKRRKEILKVSYKKFRRIILKSLIPFVGNFYICYNLLFSEFDVEIEIIDYRGLIISALIFYQIGICYLTILLVNNLIIN